MFTLRTSKKRCSRFLKRQNIPIICNLVLQIRFWDPGVQITYTNEKHGVCLIASTRTDASQDYFHFSGMVPCCLPRVKGGLRPKKKIVEWMKHACLHLPSFTPFLSIFREKQEKQCWSVCAVFKLKYIPKSTHDINRKQDCCDVIVRIEGEEIIRKSPAAITRANVRE